MLKFGTLDIADTLDELVDRRTTALIMWDFATGLVARAFNRDPFVAAAGQLLSAARDCGIPVLHARQSDITWPEVGPGLIRMRMRPIDAEKIARQQNVNRPGTLQGEFEPSLRPIEGEAVFEKFLPNGFLGSDLDWRLRGRGIKTLVLAGISLETGVDGTAREALHRGYYAVIARDAVSSSSEKRCRLALELAQELHDIFDSDEIAAVWRRQKGQ